MPAVELRRLRNQIQALSNWFLDPIRYSQELKNFLEQYANRAYRVGQVVKAEPLLPSYRVAPLILRELQVEYSRLGQEQPEQALQVAEALWAIAYLEPRFLASVLLGSIPFSQGDAVLALLKSWAQPDENYQILDALFSKGTVTLRRHGAHMLLSLAEQWISSSLGQEQVLGVRCLIPLVHDENFKNLPPVFRLLSPLVHNVPGRLQADLQAVIEELIRRSPVETAYFLRQTLSIAEGQATARLIRRCLPFFAPEQQESLKAAMRAGNLS